MVEYTGLGKNSSNIQERNSFGVHRNMRYCVREINYEVLVLGRYVFYHFVDLALTKKLVRFYRYIMV